jgi:hypothetical protein
MVVFITRLFFTFALLVFALPAGSDEGKVALIAASGSNVEAMSLRDIRRLYLGLKSSDNESVRNPVINIQSEDLYDEFLKNIMRMTAGSYKRKLVKATFRQGKEEILEMKSLQELNDHLLKNKGDVSFIDLTSIENMENIEVVQILW